MANVFGLAFDDILPQPIPQSDLHDSSKKNPFMP